MVPLARFDRLTLSNGLPSGHARRNKMVAAARKLPSSGYAIEIDGLLKTEFQTREGARAGAEELKKRFPTLQVGIFDAETKTREVIELPAV
jgi:hypothetical protein